MTTTALAFMANDRYRDWVVGFLESVRTLDPHLPLFCIPHSGSIDKIVPLGRVFGFEMLHDGVDRLDAFARRLFPFHPRHRANLRKYAALTLAVDEVAYFDVDLLMLVEPARLFGHIRPGEIDLVYFATSPHWVYAARRLDRARQLFPDLRLLSAGAFVTSRRALTIDDVIGTIEANRALYRALRRRKVYDQPVLNFALHRLGKKCRSIAELDQDLAGLVSFRNPNLQVGDGAPVDVATRRQVVAIHWAGAGKRGGELFDERVWPLRRLREAVAARAEARIRAAGIAC
ncbi:MAG TPA: hypothetical protein VFA12_16370 [Stellaceae bacterium]|nr:hypothetical protein [Stellaceae bacterium]